MPQSELYRVAKKMKRANPSFNPIPASLEDKRPLGKWAGSSYHFERDFSIREKWEPDCNLGLLVADDYVIIDVDAKPPAQRGSNKIYSERTGIEDFDTLIDRNERLPQTLTASTPSGGRHYYFALTGREGEEELKNWSSCMTLDGVLIAVDLRKKGGYAMCPPSRKGAKRYRWETDEEYRALMAEMPQWILRNILDSQKKLPGHFDAQEFTNDPSANDELLDEDMELFKNSEYWQDCFEIAAKPDRNNLYIITATAPYHCSICERDHVKNSNHPFLVRNNGVLRLVCRSGRGFNRVLDKDYKKMYDDAHPLAKELVESMDTTNRAVSEILCKDQHDAIFPTAKPTVWLSFDKELGIWREENRDVVMRPILDAYVKHFRQLEDICKHLIKEDDDIWEQRYEVCKQLVNSFSMVKKKNDHLVSLFELTRDSRKDELFNKNYHLLSCSNGVYDFDKMEFREARPSDYSTMSTNIPYMDYDKHPLEKREVVERFLTDFTLGRKDLLHYLLKVLASTLTGENEDQLFYFCNGKGANGKSTLIKLLRRVLGNYGAPIPSSQVTEPPRDAQSATPSLFALLFKRGVYLTEMEAKVLHTEFLKMMAGGDGTSGRRLHGDQQEIDLVATIIIAVNDLPGIIDKTDGFWRKVVVLPCDAKFVVDPNPEKPEEKRLVKGFEKRLLKCADTFLALLIKSYSDYKQTGVSRDVQPEIVKELVQKYRESQNVPLQFVNTMVGASQDGVVTTKQLDSTFGEFCRDKGHPKTSVLVRHLYEMMDERFPPSNDRRQVWDKGQKKNVRGWKGVAMKDEESADNILGSGYEEADKEKVRNTWATHAPLSVVKQRGAICAAPQNGV